VLLGVIGEYLWRVLAQVRAREPYIIESLYGDFSTESELIASILQQKGR
jgi:hypothetical protein